ncbi:hypothetical protein ACLI4Y_14910 [Natrialbaceae archaeon A-CW3]
MSLVVGDPDRHADLADLDIDPTDGWNELHEGVTVPTEPGEGILDLDGEQIDLEGYCGGGELMKDYPEVPWKGNRLPAEYFEYGGHFWGWDDDTPLEMVFHRALGYRDPRGTFRESDFLALLLDERLAGIVMYGLFADGDAMTMDDHLDDEGNTLEARMFGLFSSGENRAGEPHNGASQWTYTDTEFIKPDYRGGTTIVTEIGFPDEDMYGSSLEMGVWATTEGWHDFRS